MGLVMPMLLRAVTGVAVGRPARGRAARAAWLPRTRCGTGRARCSSGTSAPVIDVRSSGRAPGRSRKPVMPGLLPVGEQVGQLAGGAGEDPRVRGVRRRRRARRGGPCASAPDSVVGVEEHHEIGEDVQRARRRGRRRLLGAHLGDDLRCAPRVGGRDEDDVGADGRRTGTARPSGRARRPAAGPAVGGARSTGP